IQGVVSGLVAGIEADGAFGPDNALTVIEFATADDPYASSTGTAIERLRTSVIPEVTNGSNLTVLVTGDPALAFDSDQALIERLPYVFAFVLGLSFILLLVAFRSIVVPIASILMNLLSVGAAYGLTVAVFQHGWGNDVLGVMHTPVITSWIPVFLFCILFGLSMDYHVFLLSRIREHMDHSNNNEESIVVGLQSTGRIITGAALIMVAVFGSFTLGRVAEIQQLGFGLGVAVLIDATLIRTILVPATMKLLGSSNWYWPRILAWVPKVQIEGNLAPVKLQRQEADAGTLPRETQTIRPSMAAGGE
ncbi:MAG: MMPL family transporter, partial [Thermomicrobiales bacterium]